MQEVYSVYNIIHSHTYSHVLTGFILIVKHQWMVMKYLKLQKYNCKGRSETELTGRSPLRGGGPYWTVVPSRRRGRRTRRMRRGFVSGI
jgi:hypothetical protein